MAKKMNYKWATTVTPFSSFMALILFVFLPIGAFYFGKYYQKTVDTQIPQQQTLMEHTVSNVNPNRLVISSIAGPNAAPQYIKTISDPKAILQMYTEMSNLPTATKEVIHCPIDYEKRFVLDFYYDQQLLSHAVVDPTGCRSVWVGNMEGKSGLNSSAINELQQNFSL